MSKEAVEAVMGKALLDAEFRKALFADPEKALAGYDLSETEKAQLKGLDSETLDAMSSTLDTRVSKSATTLIFRRGLDKTNSKVFR